MPIFRLTDVKYSYLKRFPALDGVDLEIRAGESVVFSGQTAAANRPCLSFLRV